MAKRNNVAKDKVRGQVVQSGPAVLVEYPREGEIIMHPTYAFQIGALPAARGVEVSIDNGDWRPCRESFGLWWYDWTDYAKGEHTLAARSRLEDGISAASTLRHFTVA